MILCGDVGGTRVRLGWVEEQSDRLVLKEFKEYLSQDWPDFYSVLDEFLKGHNQKASSACIGAAGPVDHGRCEVTHLPWVLEINKLSEQVGVPVKLINDLAAMAASIPFLEEADTVCLQEGEKRPGRMAVLAAGTGLGQAALIPSGDRYQILDTEGGQCDFASRSDLEMEFSRFLRKQFGRVSIEQVLSGSGLANAFQFFLEKDSTSVPDELKSDMEEGAPAKSIIDWGLSRRFNPCTDAVQLFVKVYGAVAGNLALQLMAQGGVWLGGGLAPKLVSLLKESMFLDVFRDKGQFSEWMRSLPVHVIVNEQASLIGAAGYALGTRFEDN